MKKIIVLLVLLLVAFILVCRYRLYVRDPLATVTRAGTQESGAQVYINYANDVLLVNEQAPRYLELVQHGQNAGVPQKITCIHWAACLLDADIATVLPGSAVQVGAMDSRQVRFRDERGPAIVTLR